MKRLMILALLVSACGQSGSTGAQGPAGPPGLPGSPGLPGNPGSSISQVITCPGKSGNFPEILWCVDGTLYAVYDDFPSGNIRNVTVTPGTYVTTDGRSCHFTVGITCTLTNEH